jgi:hypothetical protein
MPVLQNQIYFQTRNNGARTNFFLPLPAWTVRTKAKSYGQKIEILQYYREYGLQKTQQRYHISRSIIYKWLRETENFNTNLYRLHNLIRRPRALRQKTIEPEVVKFMKDVVREYPTFGRKRIQRWQLRFCQIHGYKPLSETNLRAILKYIKSQ